MVLCSVLCLDNEVVWGVDLLEIWGKCMNVERNFTHDLFVIALYNACLSYIV